MIEIRRIISTIAAFVVVLPVIFIPSAWGLTIPEMELVRGSAYGEGDEMTDLIFIVLNLYFIIFVLATVFPYVYLFIQSQLNIAKDLKIKRTRKDRHDLPKVSIIIPCYNEEIHISRTIANCFSQDYKGPMELIVIDDGSKDSTWSLGKIFDSREKDREIRVYHKENGGKASALEFGIKKAAGSIILMTDGDSGMDTKAVTSIVNRFDRYEDAAIVGGFVFIRNTDSGYLTRLQQLEYILTQHLIRTNQSEDGSVLIAPGPIFGIRRDIARLYPPLSRTIVEDCDLTMSILPSGYTTRASREAISYTTAPETWKGWTIQRKRWIYGQFQAWRENRWHLKRNPWAIYTYFTWLTTTISALIFASSLLLMVIFLISGRDYYLLLQFISLRAMAIIAIYLFIRISVLIQYSEGRRNIHYIPLKVVYDLINGFLTAYLYIMYVSGKGTRVKWGTRKEVVH